MWLLFLILIVVFLVMGTTNEGFVEMFGFSGYKKPIEVNLSHGIPDLTGWTLSSDQVTRDETDMVVGPSTEYFKQKTGLCAYAIETNNFQKYTKEKESPVYKARFMLSTTNTGFPYGIGCTFYVKDGKVIGAQTQQLPAPGNVKAYEGEYSTFLPYGDIVSDKNKTILSR